MRGTGLVVATACLLGLASCRGRSETPPEVAREYRDLVGSLDESSPGASFARLRDFARRNTRYAIVASADTEVEAWRARLEPAYLRSRDLVRAEQFDEAERILKDLAPLRDERAGRLAQAFLAYDFYQAKASRLLMKGDVAGAQAVARELSKKPLTEEQVAATQRLLDSASTVDAGTRMMRVSSYRSAARSVQVLLHSMYADDGQYPGTLTLESAALADLRRTGLLDGIAAIEGYAASPDAFSFVLVGKDPHQRLRVTHSTIEEVGSVSLP